MDNENFEIDNILENDRLFKPITDGLGFHHSIKDEKEIKSTLSQKSMELKRDLETRANELGLRSSAMNVKSATNMGDLAPFYNQQTKENNDVLSMKEVSFEFEEAPLYLRFFAWGIDLFLVATLISISFISIMIFSQLPLDYLRKNLVGSDLLMAIISLSTLFYCFYFSFFDKTNFSTPGKRILNLRVVNIQGASISFLQALLRVSITLCSLLTLGLGSILKTQDKFTDTLVIKNNV